MGRREDGGRVEWGKGEGDERESDRERHRETQRERQREGCHLMLEHIEG